MSAQISKAWIRQIARYRLMDFGARAIAADTGLSVRHAERLYAHPAVEAHLADLQLLVRAQRILDHEKWDRLLDGCLDALGRILNNPATPLRDVIRIHAFLADRIPLDTTPMPTPPHRESPELLAARARLFGLDTVEEGDDDAPQPPSPS